MLHVESVISNASRLAVRLQEFFPLQEVWTDVKTLAESVANRLQVPVEVQGIEEAVPNKVDRMFIFRLPQLKVFEVPLHKLKKFGTFNY